MALTMLIFMLIYLCDSKMYKKPDLVPKSQILFGDFPVKKHVHLKFSLPSGIQTLRKKVLSEWLFDPIWPQKILTGNCRIAEIQDKHTFRKIKTW